MKRIFSSLLAPALLLAATALQAQDVTAGSAASALLSRADTRKALQDVINLLQASSVAIPALARTAAPLAENARQDAITLQNGPLYNNTAVLYRLLTNVRVYLELSDALPKPTPFADEARKQLVALRDDQDRLQGHFRALLEQKEQQLANADRDNLRRYADANRAVAAQRPGENRVVFLGDSITDGWRLNEYFSGKPYVNRGISGQITIQMLGRMKADVIDLKPAAMIVLAGTNDIARGIAITTIENNLAMIADLAVANHIKPIFSSILPVSDYHKDQDPAYEMTKARPPATIREINSWLETFCKQRGFTYCNYFPATVDDQGFIKSDFANDGLHPNSAGYRAMGPVAQEAIDRTLVAAPAPPPKRRFGFLKKGE